MMQESQKATRDEIMRMNAFQKHRMFLRWHKIENNLEKKRKSTKKS